MLGLILSSIVSRKRNRAAPTGGAGSGDGGTLPRRRQNLLWQNSPSRLTTSCCWAPRCWCCSCRPGSRCWRWGSTQPRTRSTFCSKTSWTCPWASCCIFAIGYGLMYPGDDYAGRLLRFRRNGDFAGSADGALRPARWIRRSIFCSRLHLPPRLRRLSQEPSPDA